VPIRWKYFIALLFISLVPLLTAGWIMQRGTQRLESTVSDVAGREITRMVTKQLEQDAENASKSVLRGMSALTFALRSLAVEAEQLLERPFVLAPRVYYSKDFEQPLRAPGDLTEDRRYTRRTPEGVRPMPVSFGHPVFMKAAGVEPRRAAPDLARLSRLTPVCRDIFGFSGYAAHRVYVALESGVSMAYPGFGGYPEGLDLRKAAWYGRARESGKTEWSGLLYSRNTGRVLIALNRPLYGPEGRFAGVAGIEAPVSWFLQEARLASQWSEEMRSFLVSARIDPQRQDLGLQIMAERHLFQNAERADAPVDYRWMRPVDDPEFAGLVERIRGGGAGSLEMEYEGRPAIWAFSPVEGSTAFLLVVPKAVAMTVPDRLRKDVTAHAAAQRSTALLAALVVVAGAALLSFLGAKRASDMVMLMVGAWQRLAGGDYSARLDMRTRDERDLLVQAFNETVPKLEDHVRLSRSMALAREVQQNLVPRRPPQVPGLDVSGTIVFCDETGGDYYDAFALPGHDGKVLAVAVGDVSGHGAAPALLMATVRAMLRAASETRRELCERVALVNRRLYDDVAPTGRFMTLFCAEFDTRRGVVRWVRAGHEPAWLYDPWTGEFEELRGEGVSLGFLEDATFQEQELGFDRRGQFALLATDGVWESVNADGESFGRARMLDVVRRNADRSAAEIVQAVLDALERFCGGVGCEDDITLAVVKRD